MPEYSTIRAAAKGGTLVMCKGRMCRSGSPKVTLVRCGFWMFPIIGMLAAVGCIDGKKVERFTRATVDSGLEELVRDENRERLKTLLTLIDESELAYNAARGTVAGSVDAFADAEIAQKTAALGDALIEHTSKSVASAIRTELGPRIREKLLLAIEDVLQTVLAGQYQEQIYAMASGIVEAATTSFTRSLAKGIENELGAAVASGVDKTGAALAVSLENTLAPALEHVVRQHMTPALADATRQLCAVLQDSLVMSLDEFEKRVTFARQQVSQHIQDSLDQGRQTAETWFPVLAAISVVLTLLFAFVCVLWRKKGRDVFRADQTIRLLTGAICDADPHGSVVDLLTKIRSPGDSHEAGLKNLKQFLARNKHLRVVHDQRS